MAPLCRRENFKVTNCIQLDCQELAIQPDCYNLSIQRGTDNALEVIVTDGDGAAIDISLDTITLTVKTARDGDLVFAKSNGPGDHIGPIIGKTVFDVAAGDTATASTTATTYWVFDVRRVTAGGDERIHIRGDFIVEPTV